MAQYDQYLEQTILTASPMELVRTLYRLVLDNVRQAAHCLVSGDIAGRGKAVSTATDALLELLTSLDHQQGGALSRNLSELYGYMASRMLQGHMDQDATPFDEVERLVSTLLDAWENVEFATPAAGSVYGSVNEAYTPLSASF